MIMDEYIKFESSNHPVKSRDFFLYINHYGTMHIIYKIKLKLDLLNWMIINVTHRGGTDVVQ